MSNINLDKTSWELVEILKETVKKNLLTAINSEQLKVDQETLPKLFGLLDASMSEGYSKSYKAFSQKFEKVSKEIAAEESNATSVSKKRK